MPTKEETKEQARTLATKIIKLVQELDPNSKRVPQQMDGIAIFMFPANSEETGHLRYTMVGVINFQRMMQCILQTESEQGIERMPIA
jgi:hypothetical protein